MEARRRWDITRSWREEYDVDRILEKPHPHFDTIKRHWPHFFLPHAKNGDPVYVERTGEFNMPAMLAEGVGIDALLCVRTCVFACLRTHAFVEMPYILTPYNTQHNSHHCVFSTEYLYHHICDDYNKRKLITVYDLAGANLGDLRGEVCVFCPCQPGLTALNNEYSHQHTSPAST